MRPSSEESREILAAIAGLRAEIDRLHKRIDGLEERFQDGSASQTVNEPMDAALVLVISAAIAAFLGKRPRVRQIRLVGSTAWAQQGRIAVQASHVLDVQH